LVLVMRVKLRMASLNVENGRLSTYQEGPETECFPLNFLNAL